MLDDGAEVGTESYNMSMVKAAASVDGETTSVRVTSSMPSSVYEKSQASAYDKKPTRRDKKEANKKAKSIESDESYDDEVGLTPPETRAIRNYERHYQLPK